MRFIHDNPLPCDLEQIAIPDTPVTLFSIGFALWTFAAAVVNPVSIPFISEAQLESATARSRNDSTSMYPWM